MNVLIGADIVPTKSNEELFENGKKEKLIGEGLSKIMDKASYIIMNLEVPLVDKKTPIEKCGPNLIASTKSITGLKKINPYFYTLANNHIFDQGEEGLKSTCKILEVNNISYAGVGKNLKEMRKFHIAEFGNLKLGIYCCAEHEFSIATENSMGANPFDILYAFDDVKGLKEKCDKVIVLYHGGKEHYRYPSPNLRRIFCKFAEVGADYIIAQHTHCIGCMEEYNGAYLIYGQENFLFDNSNNEYWQTSLLIEVDIEKENNCKFILIVKNNNVIRLAKEEEFNNIMNEFYKRSQDILKENFVEEKYIEYSNIIKSNYFNGFLGKISSNIVFRIINKLFNYKLSELLYSKKECIILENILECEAHREIALNIVKNSTRNKKEKK